MISEQLFSQVEDLLHSGDSAENILQELCILLKNTVAHYDWVGIYVVPANAVKLVLGPFSGAPTNHTKIAFGQGVCGRAAASGRTIIVQDVSRETNYLSCSLHVQSEIVVPVKLDEQVIAEIDIDSHQHSPFTQTDRIWLERLAVRIAPLTEEYRQKAGVDAEKA